MDANQRQKFLQQLLRIVTDPERRTLARDLFSEEGNQPRITDEPKVKKGLSRLWGSTPAWGAISVLAGLLISQISLKLVFFVAWAILWAEFVRAEIFSHKWLRRIGNIAVGVALAVLFIEIRPHAKPKEQPSLDQQMDLLANRLSQRFPWLASPPAKNEPIQQPVPLEATTVEFTKYELVRNSDLDKFFNSGYATPVRLTYRPTESHPAHDEVVGAETKVIGNFKAGWPATAQVNADENTGFSAFRKKWLKFDNKSDQGFTDERIIDVISDRLTFDEVRGIGTGTSGFYLFAAVRWTDDTGTYETDLCRFLSPVVGSSSNPIAWSECLTGHSGVRRKFIP